MKSASPRRTWRIPSPGSSASLTSILPGPPRRAQPAIRRFGQRDSWVVRFIRRTPSRSSHVPRSRGLRLETEDAPARAAARPEIFRAGDSQKALRSRRRDRSLFRYIEQSISISVQLSFQSKRPPYPPVSIHGEAARRLSQRNHHGNTRRKLGKTGPQCLGHRPRLQWACRNFFNMARRPQARVIATIYAALGAGITPCSTTGDCYIGHIRC